MLLREPVSRYEEIYGIYEEAFPKCERREKEDQRKVMEHPGYRLLVWEENGKILAFLGYWELSNCTFIEHLATTAACRGRGIGKELVKECIGTAKRPIFLEIEPITEKQPMTGRRAGFYERLGFHINRFPYLQMPLRRGDRPTPLWILSHGREYGGEEFLPYKKEIYRVLYGVECCE